MVEKFSSSAHSERRTYMINPLCLKVPANLNPGPYHRFSRNIHVIFTGQSKFKRKAEMSKKKQK
jgi:hypothetical protein